MSLLLNAIQHNRICKLFLSSSSFVYVWTFNFSYPHKPFWQFLFTYHVVKFRDANIQEIRFVIFVYCLLHVFSTWHFISYNFVQKFKKNNNYSLVNKLLKCTKTILTLISSLKLTHILYSVIVIFFQNKSIACFLGRLLYSYNQTSESISNALFCN